MAEPVTLDVLRGYAVARSLFPPIDLARAIERLAFVQADPIRAPARAQDLTLRHRVRRYRAGDLERRYAALDVEEEFFINYGFVPRSLRPLMHPRVSLTHRSARASRVQALLAYVRERGTVHPRDVDAHFAHGRVTNYWGGSSSATTHLLEKMHYRGLLRVAGRDTGIRLYQTADPIAPPASVAERRQRVDALADRVVHAYAPLPARSLAMVIRRLRYAAPQWSGELPAALHRARHRLAHARVDGVDWYWPAAERAHVSRPDGRVRLLAPFDPIVWDRHRFELFWGWAYRFEAYTPAAQRKLGYYALPLLWRDQVIGWGNVSLRGGDLHAQIAYVSGKAPADRSFARELDEELDRMRAFLSPR
jgi:hypothetical protein